MENIIHGHIIVTILIIVGVLSSLAFLIERLIHERNVNVGLQLKLSEYKETLVIRNKRIAQLLNDIDNLISDKNALKSEIIELKNKIVELTVNKPAPTTVKKKSYYKKKE